MYEWWVQMSIKRSRSIIAKWSFGAIRNITTTMMEHTRTLLLIPMKSVSHMDVRDTTITDALPLANFGFIGELTVEKDATTLLVQLVILSSLWIPQNKSTDQTIHV